MQLSVGVFLLFLTSIYARSQGSSYLAGLLGADSSGPDPIIIVVDPENQLGLMSSRESDEDAAKVEKVEANQAPKNEDVYMLYNALRTQPDEELDNEAVEKLEETKQVLRQALRARCIQLEICVTQCPKPKKKQCKVKCQEKYDDYDACSPPPPKCGVDKCKPKRGRTMPPYW